MTATRDIKLMSELRKRRDDQDIMLKALKDALKHVDDDMNNRPIVLWKLRETLVDAIKRVS